MILSFLPVLLLLQSHVVTAIAANPVSIKLNTTAQIFIAASTNSTNQQRLTVTSGGNVAAIFNGTGAGVAMTNQLDGGEMLVLDASNPSTANYSFLFEFNSGSGWQQAAAVQQPVFTTPQSGVSQYTVTSQDNSTNNNNNTYLIISMISIVSSGNFNYTQQANTTAIPYDLYLHAKTYYNVIQGGDEIYTEIDTEGDFDHFYPATSRSTFWLGSNTAAYEDRSGWLVNYLLVAVTLFDPRLDELEGTYTVLSGYCSFFFSPPTGSKSMTWSATSRGNPNVEITSVTN